MDWLIGPLIMAGVVIFYVVLPLTAIWLVARGGPATRVITFIVSVIAVTLISYRMAFGVYNNTARAVFSGQFAKPFCILSEHLHCLLTNGQFEQATQLSEQMMRQKLRFSTEGQETNTLWHFVRPMEDK